MNVELFSNILIFLNVAFAAWSASSGDYDLMALSAGAALAVICGEYIRNK